MAYNVWLKVSLKKSEMGTLYTASELSAPAFDNARSLVATEYVHYDYQAKEIADTINGTCNFAVKALPVCDMVIIKENITGQLLGHITPMSTIHLALVLIDNISKLPKTAPWREYVLEVMTEALYEFQSNVIDDDDFDNDEHNWKEYCDILTKKIRRCSGGFMFRYIARLNAAQLDKLGKKFLFTKGGIPQYPTQFNIINPA